MSQPPPRPLAILAACSDWRLHQKKVRFTEQIQDQFNVETDLMFLPGPDALVTNASRSSEGTCFLAQLTLLIGAHHPAMIVLAPHFDCAGCPATDHSHEDNAGAMARWVKDKTGFTGAIVYGCAVRKADDDWYFEELGKL